jgi:diguanylate cyclase (GGDEF)-like protein/PAS domain S-box-containing protein
MEKSVFRFGATRSLRMRRGHDRDGAWTLPMWGSAAVCLVSVITIWAGAAHIIGEDYRRTRETALHDTANLARAFDEHVIQSLQALDQTLLIARDAYLQNGVRFDLPRWVIESKFRTDVAFNISIADRSGKVIATKITSDPVRVDDREYFRFHANSRTDTLHVSKPMIGRVTGRPGLFLSRRIADETGHFAGVIILTIDPAYFTSFYQSVDTGRHGTVQLVGTDGTVRARVAGTDRRAGQSLADSMLFAQRDAHGIGSFTGIDPTDGVARITSYRTIPVYSLIVVVGLAVDDVFADTIRNRNVTIAGASLLSLLMLAFTLATLRGQHRLNASEFKFRSMFDVAPVGIALVDSAGDIRDANGAFARLVDREESELVGRRIDEFFDGPHGGCFTACPEENKRGSAPPRECNVCRPDGTRCTVLCSSSPASAAGPFTWVTMQDISERKRSETRIWNAAHYDTLTGLPNRMYLVEVLDEMLAAAIASGPPSALLLLDVDNFKVVNDTLGHEAGDLMLRKAAERLHRVRTSRDFVARYGGDEFALLLRDYGSERDLMRIARRLLRALGRRVIYRGQSVEMHASIGIALAPRHGASRTELMRSADLALYCAKNLGRNRAVMFEPTMLADAERRYRTVSSFRRALDEGRIVAVYQPEIDLASGEIVGFEALARIDDGELLPPASFAAALGDPESCRLLGRTMLDQASRDLAHWRHAGLSPRIAVNASSYELTDESYADRLLGLLKERRIPFADFEVEVTETAMLDDGVPAVSHNLRALSSTGVSIALDDFGTGYASLTHLKSLPITRVKIDRSFIVNIATDSESRSIVDTIIRLSHSLGKIVVAEGIENNEQFDELRRLCCDVGQGFAIARPMRAEDVGTFMLRNLVERGQRPGADLFGVAIATAAQ